MNKLTSPYQNKLEFIKNPVIAEFLGMQQNTAYYESDLEQFIIDNLQSFIMELFHGRTGNESLLQWLGMEKIADAMVEEGEIQPLIVVCPNLDNSRGINSSVLYREVKGKYGVVHKGRYEDYLPVSLQMKRKIV